MKNAVLLHGLANRDEYYDESLPSLSNSHWLPWLQKSLLINEIKADTPEVPHTFDFKWEDWVTEVERFPITTETTLVGHSMGGGFWARYLSEHPEVQVKKVVLVAPWLNLSHEENTSFFDFNLRPEIVQQAQSFTVFASDNDDKDVTDSIEYLRKALPTAKFVDFHDYGHFCYRDMKTDAFPELLDEILSQ